MLSDIQSGHISRIPFLGVQFCEYFTELYPFSKVRHLIAGDSVNKISEKRLDILTYFCVQCVDIMILKNKCNYLTDLYPFSA